jgi:prefoldin subunit 5
MTNDWKSNIPPSPTTYALTADPNKPLRDAHHTIRQLNDRLAELAKIHDEARAEIKNMRSTIDRIKQAHLADARRLISHAETAIAERNIIRELLMEIIRCKR